MDNELSKGFTGIEINGVRFSSIREMLIYIDKQRYRIIDLEKELENLKTTYRKQRNKRIDALQKENAELNSRLNAINSLTPELEKSQKLRKQQLAKAKEIIKRLINACCAYGATGRATAEAEQFLKDCEVTQ